MKLYIILYVANVVAGTWGPLPYDLKECHRQAELATAEIKEKAALHPEVKINPDEWEFMCSNERPALGDPRGD